MSYEVAKNGLTHNVKTNEIGPLEVGVAFAKGCLKPADATMLDLTATKLPLERDILCHLIGKPEASDTVEGIVEWWLLEQRIQHSVTVVKAALAELAAKEFIVVHEGTDGRANYRLNLKKKQEILTCLNVVQK